MSDRANLRDPLLAIRELATPRDVPVERVLGCLLGGATGDALGAPVEFLLLAEITERFGSEGIRDLAPAYGRLGAITDDTQMALFTAEGCLRAIARGTERGICHPPTIIYHAYLRWLRTQGVREPEPPSLDETPGWLIGVHALHSRRAPGNTCLSALESGRMGSVAERINNSKGCGGVMRVAPIGLLPSLEDAFELGCEAAAITHGHPSGFLAAGALACMVRDLATGSRMSDAVISALERVKREPEHAEISALLERAIDMAFGGTMPTAERLESIGAGWVAEEALAMSVYCAIACEDDFERGVLLAVNHGGDSDSTGAITGNLLGVHLGVGAIPARWLEKLEVRAEIEAVANDVVTVFEEGEGWWQRYPGC